MNPGSDDVSGEVSFSQARVSKRVPWLRRPGKVQDSENRQRRLRRELGMPSSTAFVGASNIGKTEQPLGETVTAVALSADNAVFVATAMNKRVVCYSSVDGAELASFTANTAPTAVRCFGTRDSIKLVVGTFTGAQPHPQMLSSPRRADDRAVSRFSIDIHVHAGDLRFYAVSLYAVSEQREILCIKFGAGGAVNCISVCKPEGDPDTRICVGGQSAFIIVYQVQESDYAHKPPGADVPDYEKGDVPVSGRSRAHAYPLSPTPQLISAPRDWPR